MSAEHQNEVMVSLATIKQELIGMRQIGEMTLEQARKTNGRMTKAEQEIEILKIINAGNEGGKTALKPYQTFLFSVVASVLVAILINFAIK